LANTNPQQRPKAFGVTREVMTGLATPVAVSTTRRTYGSGVSAVFPIDALAHWLVEMHDLGIDGVFSRLRETGTARDVPELLGTGQGW